MVSGQGEMPTELVPNYAALESTRDPSGGLNTENARDLRASVVYRLSLLSVFQRFLFRRARGRVRVVKTERAFCRRR
jgi:hypothetical protein